MIVGAARVTVFLDLPDAFLRRSGNGTDFAEDFVRHRFAGRLSPTPFHGVGHWTQFLEGQGCAFQQDVG